MSDIITLQHREKRFPFSDVITEVKVEVNPAFCFPEHNLISGKELSRFCFIDHFRAQGCDIGARNPYDERGAYVCADALKKGTMNSYIVSTDPHDWHQVT